VCVCAYVRTCVRAYVRMCVCLDVFADVVVPVCFSFVVHRRACVHPQLSKSNIRMTHQLKTQEDDRLFLVKQLVAIKKENARLRMAVSAQTATMSLDSSASSMALLASAGTCMRFVFATRKSRL
jgi:hypothetical protein